MIYFKNKIGVLITSCELDEAKNEMNPCVFVNYHNQKVGKFMIDGLHIDKSSLDSSYADNKISELARATSAAYPYFSATKIKDKFFVDGGFLFNNVDILTTNFLLSQNIDIKNIKVFSVGNCPT